MNRIPKANFIVKIKIQNADKGTVQSIITKVKGKKLRTDGLVKKTTYKTDKNSL